MENTVALISSQFASYFVFLIMFANHTLHSVHRCIWNNAATYACHGVIAYDASLHIPFATGDNPWWRLREHTRGWSIYPKSRGSPTRS